MSWAVRAAPVLAAALASVAGAPAKPAAPARLVSLLRAAGPATCVWTALPTPEGRPETLATFAHACAGGTVVVARAGDQALVRFRADAGEDAFKAEGYPPAAFAATAARGGKDELWRVPLAAGAAPVRLPELPAGTLARVGFDAEGRPVALALVELPPSTKVTKEADKDGEPVARFTFQGQAYELPVVGGSVAVAYAYRLGGAGAGAAWERFEDKPTTTGWDYALGADALDAAKLWRGRADLAAEDWESQEVGAAVQAALRRALKLEVPAVPPGSNDGFIRLRPHGKGRGELLVWQMAAEFAHDTGLVLFHAPGSKDFAPLPGLGYTAGDLVRLTFQGDYGLVTTAGLGAHPRLYDLRSGKLLFGSDQDVGAVFWRQATM